LPSGTPKRREPKAKAKSTAPPAVAADAMSEADRLALTGGQPALNDVQARYMRERVKPPEEFVIEAIVKKKPQFLDVPTHVAKDTTVAVPTSPSGPQHGPGYSPDIEAARWGGVCCALLCLYQMKTTFSLHSTTGRRATEACSHSALPRGR
jgi:hypothetical protein